MYRICLYRTKKDYKDVDGMSSSSNGSDNEAITFTGNDSETQAATSAKESSQKSAKEEKHNQRRNYRNNVASFGKNVSWYHSLICRALQHM